MSKVCRSVVVWILTFISPVYAHVSSLPTHEHREGETYTTLSFGENEILLLYTVPRKLAGKYASKREDFLPRLEASMIVSNQDKRCHVHSRESNDDPSINAWQYELRYKCANELDEVQFAYDLFDDMPFHTNLVEFQIGDHFSTMAMGRNLHQTQVPIQYIIWEQGWTLPDEPAPIKGKARSIWEYFELGYRHVLTGYDHMAFLLGLMLVVRRMKTLLFLITSFTVAHSITLALSGLDIASFPVNLTEAAIAFTIVYIGAENLWYLYRTRVDPDGMGHALQRRWATTFGFGLIHGFGFSFILRQVGLGQDQFVPALFLFNAGVEAAQISAVILPFLLVRRVLIKLPQWGSVSVFLSVGIVAIGGWWLVERTLPLWWAG